MWRVDVVNGSRPAACSDRASPRRTATVQAPSGGRSSSPSGAGSGVLRRARATSCRRASPRADRRRRAPRGSPRGGRRPRARRARVGEPAVARCPAISASQRLGDHPDRHGLAVEQVVAAPRLDRVADGVAEVEDLAGGPPSRSSAATIAALIGDAAAHDALRGRRASQRPDGERASAVRRDPVEVRRRRRRRRA